MGDRFAVLVVGAGAVGQVFAHRLKLGGAQITFFVRPKYREEVERGFDMYPLNGRGRDDAEPERFEDFDVVTSAEDAAKKRVDQVYLTVPSSALRGAWLAEVASAIGDATLISLQPGPDDRAAILASGAHPERLVTGLVSFIAYAAPLPGETRFTRPGVAYWFPPFSPSAFSGPPDRTAAVVFALRRGALPAKLHHDVPRLTAFPTAIMMVYLTAIETAGWSLRAVVESGRILLGARAVREAIAIVARTAGPPPLLARVVARPLLLRLALWFGVRLTPFPLEAYLKKHFTKVGAQTRLIVSSLIEKGKAAALSVEALEKLAALPAAPESVKDFPS